jgi:hypothetical protein
LFISAISDGVSNHDNNDSDCNYDYVEMDYNGDNEKDAEDYRIQTEACE